MSQNGFIGIGRNPNPKVPDIPEGFSAALTQDSSARTCFQGLSDTQKTNVIKYIQSNNVTGNDAKYKINSAIENLRNNSLNFIDTI